MDFLKKLSPHLTQRALTAGLVSLTTLYLGKRYFNGGVNRHKPQMTGKRVIITGANTGVGKETAIELAKLGAIVVIACRDQKRGETAANEIREITQNRAVEFMKLDLADLSSVRAFAEAYKAKYEKLDILINNGGVMALPNKAVSKDGFELQMATNHYGHFLLTMLLLPLLKNSQPSRIINLSSIAHRRADFDFENLNCEKGYRNWVQYGNSKLANIYFSQELQNQVQDQKIKCVSLHPGAVRTELTRYLTESFVAKAAFFLLTPLIWYFFKSANQGAQTTLHCALCDFGDLQGGKYYKDCKVAEPNSKANNQENAKKLWDLSLKNVGLV